MNNFTFNARLITRTDADATAIVADARINLTAAQVADYAKEISATGVAPRTQLLIETLINGENYQQFLSREIPGTTHGGFVFNTSALRNTDGYELGERSQAFAELAQDLGAI